MISNLVYHLFLLLFQLSLSLSPLLPRVVPTPNPIASPPPIPPSVPTPDPIISPPLVPRMNSPPTVPLLVPPTHHRLTINSSKRRRERAKARQIKKHEEL